MARASGRLKAESAQHIVHPFPAFYKPDSRVLILGSFPSVKSREANFFYGHPMNRFWKLMAALFSEEVPAGIPEKRAFLARHQIALWDSIHACDITGSSDASIRNVEPNDFSKILSATGLRRIYTNGKKSHEVYQKYCLAQTGIEDVCLPSTSPANAAWTLDKLAEAWRVVTEA